MTRKIPNKAMPPNWTYPAIATSFMTKMATKSPCLDAFVSLILFYTFEYFINDIIYSRVSEHYLTPSDTAYGIGSFLLSTCAAVLYLLFRKYSIPAKSYLINNKNEWFTVVFGMVLCVLITFIEQVFGLHNTDPYYLELFQSEQLPFLFLSVSYALFLAPFLQVTFFLGFFLEILKEQLSLPGALLLTVLALTFAFVTQFTGIVQAIFFICNQLVIMFVYIRGGLGASILVYSFFNLYLFFF